MNSDVLQALISAGIRPAEAGRLATAIDKAYSPGERSTSFSRPSSDGIVSAVESENFALFASAPGTSLQDESPVGAQQYGPGGAALGVAGASVLDGDVYASGKVVAGSIQSHGSIATPGSVSAATASVSSVDVAGVMSLSKSGIDSDKPVVSRTALVGQGSNQFTGETQVDGPLYVNDQQLVGGVEYTPANIQVLGSVGASGSSLQTLPLEIGVAASHGTGVPGRFDFTFVPTGSTLTNITGITLAPATQSFLTAATPVTGSISIPTTATVSAAPSFTYVTSAVGTVVGSPGSVTVPEYATVGPVAITHIESGISAVTPTTADAVTGLTINAVNLTYVTGVTFDPSTCSVTVETSSIDVVTAITENKSAFVTGISTTNALPSTTTVGAHGNAPLGGGIPYVVLTDVSTSPAATATASGLGAAGAAALGGATPQDVVTGITPTTGTALTDVTATPDTQEIAYVTGGDIDIAVS